MNIKLNILRIHSLLTYLQVLRVRLPDIVKRLMKYGCCSAVRCSLMSSQTARCSTYMCRKTVYAIPF